MIKFYSFFDSDLKLYNKPFVAADDKSAIKFARDLLICSNDTVLNKVLPITELHFVGVFDETSGFFYSDSEHGLPYVVCALSDIPICNPSISNIKEVE